MRVGIDEAGKGPVLGPMVAAAVGVPDPAVLPDGVADSKRLAAERRERLAERLREHDDVRVGVAPVAVERIDDPATDVNSLTVAAHAEALAACSPDRDDGDDEHDDGGESDASGDSGDSDPPSVLVDACDTSEARFARRVADACEGDPAVEARHGADDDDPVVAAASVVAKVERDARVAELAAAYDADVGSGYPSDPTTREFLETYVGEHGELPDCARSSWQTCDDVLAAAEQSGLGQF